MGTIGHFLTISTLDTIRYLGSAGSLFIEIAREVLQLWNIMKNLKESAEVA